MLKKRSRIQLALLTLLSLSFLTIGGLQLFGKMNADFVRWFFPLWSIYIIGAVQVLSAIGIWFQKTLTYSAMGLLIITIGAIFTLIGHHEWPLPMLPPVALFLLTCALLRFNSKP